MAYARHLWRLIADFGKSHYVDAKSTGINLPAEYEADLPELWAGNSFQLQVECWRDYNSGNGTRRDFDASATTKLYIKRQDSTEDPVELDAAGVVSQDGEAEYHLLTYSVPKDTLPDYLAGEECLLYGEVTDTSDEDTWAIVVKVVNEDGDADNTLDTSDIPLSVSTISADTTLTARPGLAVYQVDGAWTVTLPSAAAEDQQEIILQQVAAAQASVVGTVNGDAAGFVLASQYDTAHLVSDGTNWYNLNHVNIVR